MDISVSNKALRPAFINSTSAVIANTFAGTPVCTVKQKLSAAPHESICLRRIAVITAVSRQQNVPTEPTLRSPTNWPPPDMTDEWAEAVLRLTNSVQNVSLENADEALGDADGDEMLALKYLMEDNRSEIQKQRERVVEEARAAGDVNRVSAVKEAQLRRRATGSARDFFKGFVEVEGQYIDAGYVDESADTMGRIMGKLKGWFGNSD